MPQFRKKPVVIEACQWPGKDGEGWPDSWIPVPFRIDVGVDGRPQLIIPTLEGAMRALEGDWIIRGIKGEFYPCKPDIFEATYEAVPPAASEEERA